jgi:hypothetical protein
MLDPVLGLNDPISTVNGSCSESTIGVRKFLLLDLVYAESNGG